jgi:diamine N-acetyltransferase
MPVNSPSTDYQLRLAVDSDASSLAALAIQVWLHTYATQGIRSVAADYVLAEFTAEKFTAHIANPSAELWVAERKQHLVGYALLKFGAPCPIAVNTEIQLATLYVQAHFIGQGIGAALLAHCHSRLPANETLWLMANAQNAHAIAFYKQHGYTQAGLTYFELSGERHENVVLVSG